MFYYVLFIFCTKRGAKAPPSSPSLCAVPALVNSLAVGTTRLIEMHYPASFWRVRSSIWLEDKVFLMRVRNFSFLDGKRVKACNMGVRHKPKVRNPQGRDKNGLLQTQEISQRYQSIANNKYDCISKGEKLVTLRAKNLIGCWDTLGDELKLACVPARWMVKDDSRFRKGRVISFALVTTVEVLEELVYIH